MIHTIHILNTLISSILILSNNSVFGFHVNFPKTKSPSIVSPSFHYRYNSCDKFGISNSKTCFNVLLSSKGDDDGSNTKKSTRKRRTRRKKDSILQDTASDAQTNSGIDDDVVEIQIQDVNAENTNTAPSPMKEQSTNTNIDEDDKLKSLLADAKRLRQSSEEKEESDNTLKEILSTIVTIDFFVVFGFLIWFLLGVVSSNVLKDDTIQIAFNGIFQPLVQPALGILMIASVASGVTGQEKEE